MAGAEPAAIALVGPTATGKTALALRLAGALGAEIVGVDSRQAYRGLQVGTAAPTPAERAAVPHHGVGFLEPEEDYGAGRFARLARGWIAEIRERDRLPLLVGGTGFFLRALTRPVFREPEMEPARRDRLRGWAEGQAPERLRRFVRRLDPGTARRLGTVDPQRAARSLELALLSGRPLAWWHRHGEPEAEPLRPRTFVLELPAAEHRRRIRERTRRLLAGGWPEEVRALRARGVSEGSPAFEALGYREVARMLRGELSPEETAREISRATWRYARRQRSWFRNQLGEEAVRLDATGSTEQLAARVLEAR